MNERLMVPVRIRNYFEDGMKRQSSVKVSDMLIEVPKNKSQGALPFISHTFTVEQLVDIEYIEMLICIF